MGGWGSGRRWSAMDTTGAYKQLDVRRLQRDGLLERRWSFNWQWSRNGEPRGDINIRPESDRVILDYRSREHGGEWTEQEYPVMLERTRCHYGGERVWFRCPARGCGRRVAIFYGGTIFACRHCHRLAYPCQHESPGDRADSRAWKIRKRCVESGEDDWGGLFDPVFKPKGMHQRTFDRLEREYEFYQRISIFTIAEKLNISTEGLLADSLGESMEESARARGMG